MNNDDLHKLIELCSIYSLTLKLWPNGEEVSIYLECGDFEHPREAIAWIKEAVEMNQGEEDGDSY